MQTPQANLYEFGDFQLDRGKRVLRRVDGTPVPLTPRVFDTLLYMVEHHDSVLDKERIMEAVWPDSIVEENNLAQAISKLRQIFGETPGSHSYIVTVPGRGYRFVAEVKERTDGAVKDETANGRLGETASSQPTSGLAGSPQKPEAVEATAEVADSPAHRFPDSSTAALPPKTGWSWVSGFLAVAILSSATLLFVRYRSLPASAPAPSSPAQASPVSTPIPEKSVAVLPFENLSDEKQNAYFAAGVQDEITTNLARIAELKVVSRTSANLYKSGNPRNSREIGQQLGVAHLLEGNVQRIGNRLRVNAQLINAHTDTHSWAQTYDRDVADLFAIQSEIAQAIAGQLHAKISPAQKLAIERPPTADVSAFDLYSHAKTLTVSISFTAAVQQTLLQAADLLNQAVARDPVFFQAYCLLAYTHDHLYFFGLDHTAARLALAEAAVQAAFKLRPDAGEAHLARAVHFYRGNLDYESALAELEIARQTLPNDPQIFELTGYIQRRQGQQEESVQNLERALELDPRNVFTLQQISLSYHFLRRDRETVAVLDRALAIQPDDAETQMVRAFAELHWKADASPLHQVIDSIRANKPAKLPSVASGWLAGALAERNPVGVEAALEALGDGRFGEDAVRFRRSFGEGLLARMTKDEAKARAAFTAARTEQDKIVRAQPDYGPALCVLGVIDAGLGRKEQALRAGRRAMELLPVAKDPINGAHVIEYFAVIAAWVGEQELACEQLEIATRLSGGGLLSYGQLKLSPFWDPLRGYPRFEKIVASFAPKGN